MSKTQVKDFIEKLNWERETGLLLKVGKCRGSVGILDQMLSIFPIKWEANFSVQSLPGSRYRLVTENRADNFK